MAGILQITFIHWADGRFTARFRKDAKSRSREIGCHDAAADVSIKFQSDWKCLNPNLAALRLHEILR